MAFNRYKVDYIIKVTDGDTVRAHLDMGLDKCSTETIRLLNVFTKEINEPGGIEAQMFIEDWLATKLHGGIINTVHTVPEPLSVYTYLSKFGNERASFGRWVGDIHGDVTGDSLCVAIGLWLIDHPESRGGIGT